MSFTMFFVPASLALFLLAAAMLIQGIRQGRRRKIFSAVGIFAVLAVSWSLLMEFITRM